MAKIPVRDAFFRFKVFIHKRLVTTDANIRIKNDKRVVILGKLPNHSLIEKTID